jgi:Tol biopolymer transport system component
MIIDVDTGKRRGDLEGFTVIRSSGPFKAVDFNFWGITFANDQRLYATLQTSGRRYLIEADILMRTARIIADDVECPSLSPDGTRIAFKKRETPGGRLVFRLNVLDLASRVVTELAETRSVDDQPEWLDDERVAYAIASETSPGSTDVWMVPANGTGSAIRLINGAWSPAVVHTP